MGGECRTYGGRFGPMGMAYLIDPKYPSIDSIYDLPESNSDLNGIVVPASADPRDKKAKLFLLAKDKSKFAKHKRYANYALPQVIRFTNCYSVTLYRAELWELMRQIWIAAYKDQMDPMSIGLFPKPIIRKISTFVGYKLAVE